MNRRVKNTLITIAFPGIMYLVMEVLCFSMRGTHIISSVLDFQNLVRNIGTACTIAYALSFNLGCGRFDLSLGAQRVVAATIGGIIAMKLGLTGVWLLVMAILFGFIFGALVGIVFVAARVPPMVLGIGMGLIYECVAFAGSGSKGLNLFGVEGVEILTDINFTIIVIAIAAAIVMIMLGYTKYGYQMRAIQGSQRIAQASGINIFRHAVLCYTYAGGLVAISGVFSAAFEGGMSPTMGFTSNGRVLANAFPMFLGQFLARWSNQAVGIFTATVTLKIFAAGLSGLKLTSEVNSVVNMMVFLIFLVYLANQNFFKIKKAEQARIAQAKEKRLALAAAV